MPLQTPSCCDTQYELIRKILLSLPSLTTGESICGFTPGSIVFADPNGCLTEDNSNLFFNNTANRFGVQAGSSLGTSVIQAGTGGAQNSSDTGFLNLRSFNNSGTGSGHGFADNTLITRSNGAPFGYASFDSRGNTTGSTNYDHLNGFQFYWDYASSGTMVTMSGFASAPVTNGGNITVVSHFTCADIGGAGTLNTQYGLFIGQLTRGTALNWAIYTAGTTPSFFTGTVRFASDIRLDGTGTLVLDITATLGWGSAGVADTKLVRGAGNVIAMRNGVLAQQIRINNTYTDDSNQEYLQMGWGANIATIQTLGIGTGLARALTIGPMGIAALNFQSNGSTRWLINTSAHFSPNTNGTEDIGDSTHLVRNIYSGTLDAGTNTIVSSLICTHNSSGTAAAGLGVSIVFNLQSSTTATQSAGRQRVEWDVATHASRRSFHTLSTFDVATERDTLRLGADGTRGWMGVLAGISTQYAKVGGIIFDHFTDTSTTSTDGTENDLYSDTLAASTFSQNGDKVQAIYSLITVASATATRRIQAYVAGTKVLDGGTLTFASAGTVEVRLVIIQETSTVLRIHAIFIESGITAQPILTYTRITGLTLTNTQIVKITGIAAGAGAASGDIVAKLGTLEWKAAA